MSRPSWNELRARMERAGFRPSRRFGQNFLLDEGVCRDVVRIAGVGEGDRVLEVGVGLGFLTTHLLAAGADVLGVEVDERLATIAASWLEPRERLELVVADALAGKHALEPRVVDGLWREGDWHLVANLPYSIASPLVAELVRTANPPASLTVLVQKEVAERMCASAGEREWGALGARIALTHAGRVERAVPAALFRPRPKVDSAVCRLVRRDRPLASVSATELTAYDRLVAHLFTQRRKKVRSPLADLAGGAPAADAWISAAGLDRDLRVEDLDPAALAALASAAPNFLGE
ncbi:MAG: 16S rRNA (adenine(1518)-N(6)/adenine(1519)-N(6))-dimethyltransferase RsmA [Planctomycetota bacterium]